MSKNYFYEVNDVENARFELRKRVDPDSKSYTLYKDFTSLFFEGKKLPNGEDVDIIGIIERKKDGESWWEVKIKVGECKIGLGMDYIGPSINWAQEAGLEEREILKFINVSREIGGHLIWPRWIYDGKYRINPFYSINKYRGGLKGVFDRIDYTLLYLKLWFEGEDEPFRDVFNANRVWLNKFVDFTGFIQYYKLDSFVEFGKETKIKSLSTFNCKNKQYEELRPKSKPHIPNCKEKYEQYIEGCNYIICSRTCSLT